MVEIRDYNDVDYEDVKQNLVEGNVFSAEWDSRENLKKKIGADPGSIIVAVAGGRAVGNVYIISDGWAGFMFRLAVRRACRNKGIGSLLLAEAEKRLRNRGVKYISIFAEDANSKLKEYYEKRGYVSAKAYRCMDKELLG